MARVPALAVATLFYIRKCSNRKINCDFLKSFGFNNPIAVNRKKHTPYFTQYPWSQQSNCCRPKLKHLTTLSLVSTKAAGRRQENEITRSGGTKAHVRKKFLACPPMHWSRSHNRFETVTCTVTHTQFLGSLTIMVNFTLLPATVLIPIGSRSGLDAFTLTPNGISNFRDYFRIFFLNFFISLPPHRFIFFRISSNFNSFYPTKRKKLGNKI